MNMRGVSIRRCLAWLILGLLLQGAMSATAQVNIWKQHWPETDFSTHSVDLDEIFSGGPPKDGIPAILEPVFTSVTDETQLEPLEAVMTLELPGSIPRAYPLRYLIWHEIVNDSIDGVPVAVTWCPLCNSGIFFDRRLDEAILSFGVSGNLRHSDMIMYDHQTESWWQQAVGEAIVGELTGSSLAELPGWMESWDTYRMRNPEGQVMARPEHSRPYGYNPYVGYDSSSWPFLYGGQNPPFDIHPLERVVRVGDFAVLVNGLESVGTFIHANVEFTWSPGLSSPLDVQDISDGRDIGFVRVRDIDTGEDLAHDLMFAFAYHAFYPEGEWVVPK